MNKRLVAFIFLVSLFPLSFVASPVFIVKIRSAESGAVLYCAPVLVGEEIFSDSINSIYNVPVRERWRVSEDGAIEVLDVTSSAAVMEYYHLDDFSEAGKVYRGAPKDLSYRQVLMKVDALGQERLSVRGREIVLYQLVPEAAVVEISVSSAPRIAACF